MNKVKKVCVINKDTQDVMRTELGAGNMLVMSGTHSMTTKGKLKSYLNQQSKLTKNKRILDRFTLGSYNTEILPNGRRHGFTRWDMLTKQFVPGKSYEQRLIVHY